MAAGRETTAAMDTILSRFGLNPVVSMSIIILGLIIAAIAFIVGRAQLMYLF